MEIDQNINKDKRLIAAGESIDTNGGSLVGAKRMASEAALIERKIMELENKIENATTPEEIAEIQK